VIGFPYQFMYALTGIVLIVNAVLIIPFSKYLYDGKEDQVYEALGYSDNTQYSYLYEPSTQVSPWVTSWTSWKANGQIAI